MMILFSVHYPTPVLPSLTTFSLSIQTAWEWKFCSFLTPPPASIHPLLHSHRGCTEITKRSLTKRDKRNEAELNNALFTSGRALRASTPLHRFPLSRPVHPLSVSTCPQVTVSHLQDRSRRPEQSSSGGNSSREKAQPSEQQGMIPKTAGASTEYVLRGARAC